MYCPNCELRVETEWSRITEQEEAERYHRWFDDEDIRGDYTVEDVGSWEEVENHDGSATEWLVAMRVDTCANCAVPIDARTFLHSWDPKERRGS